MFAILSGITNPSIEQSLSQLDSYSFQTRAKATDYLVENGEPYFIRIYLAGCVQGMGLEKTVRTQKVAERILYNIGSQVEAWYIYKWTLEGEYADFLFGKNWPCIYSLTYRDWRYCNCDLLGPLLTKYFWYISVDHSIELKRELYCFQMRKNQKHVIFYGDDWTRTCTKLWIVDELNKGTNPLLLSIVVHNLRICEKSWDMGIDHRELWIRSIDPEKMRTSRRELIKVSPTEVK
ncbi:hypothetical protein C4577_06425 [Candidatus Parcubacteria bacterium]|nr:MAG: hypothetical protein C4577_06425 [Candidatus Parcubacteria bacterium]